ncbi:TPA: hypothetical protein JEX48_004772 [Escherichia coli]|nr:hypothetical protein [Escherichia coli]EEQ8957629.1 hypothetical protein [Escherichia coli]EER3452535.1 hypothetical protein [Escherichia coli]EER6062836.1 hypothetical protein [Escherichia coli]EET2016864.1 hypothetical protein [Escherichia coli]
MSHNLEHQKVYTRMVKEVLKAVSRANNPPYQSVFADFIAGHPSCTVFPGNLPQNVPGFTVRIRHVLPYLPSF